MSRENVELVRQHIEAFRAGDEEHAASFLDPDIVVDATRYAAEAEIVVGLADVELFTRRFRGTFEDYDYEMTNLRDLGRGKVLAVGSESGRGKGSGVVVNRSIAGLYDVSDGRIVRIIMFTSEAEALEAAGLSE